ncbi:hypothetical protein B0H17DRAFT_1048953 [Mycena rosella]|uniref:Uncharacterized protein n=1 Tax=Mycena rosella TaxID=1033263 RepID=A0AAD7DTS0_MYCRO|nr:hypothetical protein B0H17DRAFT_1048953 [Mycena rosella]
MYQHTFISGALSAPPGTRQRAPASRSRHLAWSVHKARRRSQFGHFDQHVTLPPSSMLPPFAFPRSPPAPSSPLLSSGYSSCFALLLPRHQSPFITLIAARWALRRKKAACWGWRPVLVARPSLVRNPSSMTVPALKTSSLARNRHYCAPTRLTLAPPFAPSRNSVAAGDYRGCNAFSNDALISAPRHLYATLPAPIRLPFSTLPGFPSARPHRRTITECPHTPL